MFINKVKLMIDFKNNSYIKLKSDEEYKNKVNLLLIEGEYCISSFRALRDGVVFTNKRIIAVNTKGLTGKKKDFSSLPYKNIVAYSIETSGTFDVVCDLELCFSSLGKVKFEFDYGVDIIQISKEISRVVFS